MKISKPLVSLTRAPISTLTSAQRLAAHVKCASGVMIEDDKLYLLDSKLRHLMQKEGLSSLGELAAAVERNQKSRLADEVVQAMTINETHFFRDRSPFTALRSIVSQLATGSTKDRSLRIWSAACSTGQEIYSVAMVLDELSALLANWRIDLVGTDISEQVLNKAAAGTYSQFEVQRGLSTPLLLKYFEKRGDDWLLAKRIREKVRFQKLNLLHDFASLGRFDIVFCRNVLFYFETDTRHDILERISRVLVPGGTLFLGASEALTGLAAGFLGTSLGSGIMAKPIDAARPARRSVTN